jgi:predicted membrane-bound spermidine synthase
MLDTISNKYLLATVFITGAAVLIVEVTAVRILAPIYGSSLYVFSSVLTVILAALSLGYWYGGKRADKEKSVDEMYFFIALSGVGILFSLIISKLFLQTLGPALSPQLGPLLFSFGLFFIPAFLLGIVSPYVIKIQSLTNSLENIGSVVGATFFWGTCGSIFGSLATGFFFIPVIGVTKTISLVAVSLIALGVLTPAIFNKTLNKKSTPIILLVSIFIGISLFAIDKKINESLVYHEEGIYSSIKIKDLTYHNQPVRILLRDTNTSSVIYLHSDDLVATYSKFTLLYDSLVSEPENMLVLGGGAYTIPKKISTIDKEISIDVVEIEPILFSLAQKYFGLIPSNKINNYPMDARVFLQQESKEYDFILGDMFSTDQASPFHLTTKEYYELVSDRMSEKGVFVLNIVGVPDTSGPSLAGSTAKTLRSVFPNVTILALGEDLSAVQNIVFLVNKATEPIKLNAWEMKRLGVTFQEITVSDEGLEDEILLTDDHSPVEYLASKQRLSS